MSELQFIPMYRYLESTKEFQAVPVNASEFFREVDPALHCVTFWITGFERTYPPKRDDEGIPAWLSEQSALVR